MLHLARDHDASVERLQPHRPHHVEDSANVPAGEILPEPGLLLQRPEVVVLRPLRSVVTPESSLPGLRAEVLIELRELPLHRQRDEEPVFAPVDVDVDAQELEVVSALNPHRQALLQA